MTITGSIALPVAPEAMRRLQNGERLDVVGRRGKTPLLVHLAEAKQGAIYVRAPAGPDQAAYVLLRAAAGCGQTVLRDVARALTTSVEAAIAKLEPALEDRWLIVDDVDAIGSRGIDPELQEVLSDGSQAVRDFVARRSQVMSLTVRGAEEGRSVIDPEPQLPIALSAIWQNVDRDIDTFSVAVLREQLGQPGSRARSWEPNAIVADVWEHLPTSLRRVVSLLAVHGRAIALDEFRALALVEEVALDRAIRSDVITHRAGAVWLPKPWYREHATLEGPHRTRRLHGELAQAFARNAIGTDAHLAKPLLVLEAHRHFAELDEVERAREFAAFGAGALLESGRRLSLSGRDGDARGYADAAHSYDAVLQLDATSRQRGGGLGPRVVAYATHYKHYNRYKADLETLEETLRGYEAALEGWPENALYHSRLISGLLVADRYGEARDRLVAAERRVPDYPRRAAVLRGRTADRLLRRDDVEAALLVWGDFEPEGLDRITGDRLFQRLKAGFESKRLRSFEGQLVLHEPTHVRFATHAHGWLVHALDASALEATPAAAYTQLITAVAARTTTLHRTLTHRLTPRERMAKQTLLGLVDLAASGLLDLGDATTWVYGRLVQDDGRLVLRTDEGTSFGLPDDLQGTLTAEAGYRLARVSTGEAGEPAEPMLHLEPPLGDDPDVVFERWRALVADHG